MTAHTGNPSCADHIAIIADGNRRWAQARNLSPTDGHKAGADTLRARLYDAIALGVTELTVYYLSTENWTRPRTEITGLMHILSQRIAREIPILHRHGVRVQFIGRRQNAPAGLARQMTLAEELTAHNTRMTFCIAFDYGARAEMIHAARSYHGGGDAEFRRCLYAPDMHDPALIIRTGGERRLSNFLLWQAAHSELIFRDELWPDFTRAALEQSLAGLTARHDTTDAQRQAARRPTQSSIIQHSEPYKLDDNHWQDGTQ